MGSEQFRPFRHMFFSCDFIPISCSLLTIRFSLSANALSVSLNANTQLGHDEACERGNFPQKWDSMSRLGSVKPSRYLLLSTRLLFLSPPLSQCFVNLSMYVPVLEVWPHGCHISHPSSLHLLH
jgi:hypothetical protein